MRSGIWKRNGCLIRRQSLGAPGDFQIRFCVYRNGSLISRHYTLREAERTADAFVDGMRA